MPRREIPPGAEPWPSETPAGAGRPRKRRAGRRPRTSGAARRARRRERRRRSRARGAPRGAARRDGELRHAGPCPARPRRASASARRRRGTRWPFSELLIFVGAIGTIVGFASRTPAVDAVRRPRRGRDRHARVHDPRAPQRLPLARGAAGGRADRPRCTAASRSRCSRSARRGAVLVLAPLVVDVPRLLAALQDAARALRGRAPRARVRAAAGAEAGRLSARRRLSEGSGRSPSAGPSPRASPRQPELCRRAISRSPSRRAGWPAGRPAISFAMRLRSCRAKCGRGGAHQLADVLDGHLVCACLRCSGGGLRLRSSRVLLGLFGSAARGFFGGALLAGADLQQRVELRLRARRDRASSPISQP